MYLLRYQLNYQTVTIKNPVIANVVSTGLLTNWTLT